MNGSGCRSYTLFIGRIRNAIHFWIRRARAIRTEDVSHAVLWIKILKIIAIAMAKIIDAYRTLRRLAGVYIKRPTIFEDRYLVEDYSQTVLYTINNKLFPDFPFRAIICDGRSSKVTLIATEKNEVKNARSWLDSISHQSRLPDEIIIVDAGSTDGTLEFLLTINFPCSTSYRVIHKPGLNISQGRNLAISKATHPIIVVTDFGCYPERNWLDRLVAPFEQDEYIESAGGWYVAEDQTGNLIQRRAWPTIAQIQPDSFIPSSRSFAFKKNIWEKMGGYPEWLTLTGEDTYFALEIRKFCDKRAFVPEAIVHWKAPASYKDYWKKLYYWSTGDGETGMHGSNYWNSLKLLISEILAFSFWFCLILFSFYFKIIGFYIITIVITLIYLAIMMVLFPSFYIHPLDTVGEVGANLAMISGYLKGVGRRKAVNLRRINQVRGFFFIFAGVPFHDTGGGSRGAQIAKELVQLNYFVIYIHKFGSYESITLDAQFRHPNLVEFSLDNFSWNNFYNLYNDLMQIKPIGALIEFPLIDFLPLISHLKSLKATICYDLLDRWDGQLGSAWYKKSIEDQIILNSDVLIATAFNLTTDLETRSNRQVHLIPNAVNINLFNNHHNYIKPRDLPPSEFIITYIGALWGQWFDWDLLSEISSSYPDAAIMVIGDYRGQSREHRPNLFFLGLKPQVQLPAYLAYTNVAIIPWKVSDITLATSPLKLYEYLAMHKPVVIPSLPLLYDIPYVYISKDKNEFIQNITRAANTPLDGKIFDEFINKNSWEVRVRKITRLMGLD